MGALLNWDRIAYGLFLLASYRLALWFLGYSLRKVRPSDWWWRDRDASCPHCGKRVSRNNYARVNNGPMLHPLCLNGYLGRQP